MLDIDPAEVVEKGRLQPGKMFLVDTAQGRIVGDEEIKTQIATRKPYAQWVADNKIELAQLPTVTSLFSLSADERERLQRAFGYTREDLRTLLAAMATAGEEPTGSMGNDAALAVLSDRPVSLFRYFKQQFAQVTNPPIDPIREELVMSLVSCVGGEGNLLDETPRQCRLLELPHPILSNAGLAKFVAGELADFRTARIPITFSGSGAIPPRRSRKRSRPRVRGRRARSTKELRSSSSPTATWTPGTPRSRASSRRRAFTTTSFGKGSAFAAGS